MTEIPELKGVNFESQKVDDNNIYSDNECPVLFGHYWMKGNPILQKENVCCLDYSIAKDGQLVAYRWDGEMKLNANKFFAL